MVAPKPSRTFKISRKTLKVLSKEYVSGIEKDPTGQQNSRCPHNSCPRNKLPVYAPGPGDGILTPMMRLCHSIADLKSAVSQT